jgi:hypothetical protein
LAKSYQTGSRFNNGFWMVFNYYAENVDEIKSNSFNSSFTVGLRNRLMLLMFQL